MPLPLRAPAGALIALAITAAATACSSGAQSAQPVETDRAVAAGSTASPPDRRATVAPPTLPPLPIEDGGPLTALPECQPSPQPVQDSVPGLVLPDGAVITSVEREHPLSTVRGYVPDTPVNVRKFYQQQEDLEFSEIEDEVYEAEAFYTLGVHNVYVKAQATCATGAQLTAVVGPSGKNVPLPKVGGGSN